MSLRVNSVASSKGRFFSAIMLPGIPVLQFVSRENTVDDERGYA
jgi:hypothetical protein